MTSVPPQGHGAPPPSHKALVSTAASPGTPVGPAPAPADEAAQNLAPLLLAMLERRYLTDLDPAHWIIGAPGHTSATTPSAAHPRLHEIRALGKPPAEYAWADAVPQALTACHGAGHLLSVAMHGDGHGHRIHWGGRRLPGASRGSTEDFLQAQAGVLGAHVPGLVLGPPEAPDEGSYAGLSAFLRTAPALALVTGIPAPLHGRTPAAFQSLDHLATVLGARRYALVVAAEPLPADDLDRTLDHCRRMRSEIHALVRRTVSKQHAESSSISTGESAAPAHGLTAELSALAAFCSIVGVLPGAHMARTAAPVLHQLATGAPGARAAVQTTKSHSSSTSEGIDVLNVTAEACEQLLQRHIERLEAARAQGWWRTAVYLAADSDGTLALAAGALRGMCSGEATALDPLRVLTLPAGTLRPAVTGGEILTLTPSGGPGHPLGPAYDALATCMTSAELALLVGMPRRPVPGLPTVDIAEYALSAPPPVRPAVTVGRLLDSRGHEHAPVTLSGPALNRHVLIAGMTGYGKTTTAKNLLLDAYTELGIPFLVIEPAKAEYRHLARHPALRGRLRVYGMGPDAELPLRLNPFVPVASIPLSRHIDLLKAVFNASFPMFAGMSYVLEEAMLEVYGERGWDLHTSANEVLGRRPSAPDVAALTPSIRDLHAKIEEVLDRRGYGREVHQNLGAALRSRLGSLLVGAKGMALDTRRSVPVEDLFTRPAVIELRDLGDDEEKAFVMALLLCRLHEYAESRGADGGADGEELRHLTLIEEAHRLLRAARQPSGADVPDAQAKAVAMFTDMLAEMRAHGEGFIVADQVPTKLAPDVVKNSNVKILHRLAAVDDRAVVAAAVGLTEQQSRHLATLPPGVAVVHEERIGSAVLVRVPRTPGGSDAGPTTPGPTVPAADSGSGTTGALTRADRSYLHRHGGCRHCPAPCTVLHLADRPGRRPATDRALAPFFARLLLGTPEQLWDSWTGWRDGLHAEPARTPDHGAAYCTFAQAAWRHLAALLPAADGPTGADDAAEHLLARDRAARHLARLCDGWLTAERLDTAARKLLAEVREALGATISARPPRELPGCADCPGRCQALPLVAPRLPAFATAVGACANRPVPLDTRLRQLGALAEEHLPDACAFLPEGRARDTLLYCMTVNATAPAHDGRPAPPRSAECEQTLTALRTPGPR
ncbi:ATP-binding protein [Streptomyces sp. NPDC014891]|uniref:ATP-binding protein n=1 Tax=Streptomyces sp. NPDC014891 TaxID=3364929 RepID=UPI0036FE3571